MNARNEEFVPLLRRPLHDSSEFDSATPLDPFATGESFRPVRRHQVRERIIDSLSQHDPRREWTRPTDPQEVPRVIQVDPYRESKERLDAIEVGFRSLQRHRRGRYVDQPIEYTTLQTTTSARTPTTAPSRENATPAPDEKKKFSHKFQHLRLDRVTRDEAAPLLTSIDQETREFLREVKEQVAAQEKLQVEPPPSLLHQTDNKLAYSDEQAVEGEVERLHPTSTERERINVEKRRSHQRLRELLQATAKMPSLSTLASDRPVVGTRSGSIKATEKSAQMSFHDEHETIVDRQEKESNQRKETNDLLTRIDSLEAFLKEFHG